MNEEKKQLRNEVRRRIKSMTAEEKDLHGRSICRILEKHPRFRKAKTILFFWSLPDEVNLHPLIEKWGRKKKILLPVVIGDDTEIRLFTEVDKMQEGAFDILEPVGERFEDYSTIDLAIIPGMAFDLSGHRLGRGKGYYDKLLKKIECYKLAVCFPCQIFPSIPQEEWDEVVNEVEYGEENHFL